MHVGAGQGGLVHVGAGRGGAGKWVLGEEARASGSEPVYVVSIECGLGMAAEHACDGFMASGCWSVGQPRSKGRCRPCPAA